MCLVVRYILLILNVNLNQLSQYADRPGKRAYSYSELAVSSPAPTIVTVASTHFAYPRTDGQAELA